MHEIVIANKIIEDLKKQVCISDDGLGNSNDFDKNVPNNYDKIKSVKFEVGDLAHLTAEELKDTLKGMVKFEIIVEKKNAIVKCENENKNSEKCDYVGEAKILERGHHNLIYICPKCEKVPKIVEGGDIKIVEVEIED